MWKIGDVARLAGVTVRTLHHYDEIGLLVPSGRSEAGYRLYSAADLERLQEILLYRALGFPLDEIQALLDDPAYDRVASLRRQRDLLRAESERLGAMLAAVERTLAEHEQGGTPEPERLFDGFDPSLYEEEAEQRWGDTEAFRESRERTRRYGAAEWKAIRDEADGIARDFARLRSEGADPRGPEAIALAERHREHISRWFYACPPALHAALGAMYVEDTRFTAWWDRVDPGLAPYVRDAFAAAAERAA